MKKITRIPKYVAAILLLIYEGFWYTSKGILKYISSHPYVIMFGLFLQTFPAYLILVLCAIPFGLSEIVAGWAVILMAGGDIFNGGIVWLSSKIFGFLPTVWIFQQTKEKLLSIGWFSYLYNKIKEWKARIHNYITSLSVWNVVKKTVSTLKAWLIDLRVRLKNLALNLLTKF